MSASFAWSTFDITRVTAVKTLLLQESQRISERLEAGVVERDAHNMPLRPLSNESINTILALQDVLHVSARGRCSAALGR